jgi:predicted SAM-dependent methyltransferase
MTERLTKLELGAGERPTPGYLHQDVTQQPGVELDFTCMPWEIDLPLGCLTEVIALGQMEHLRFAEVHKTLAHLYTLLAPGGVMVFDVPDMRVWSEYLFNVTHGKSAQNPFTDEHVWSTMYGWQRWPGDEHKSGWTQESLVAAVEAAGFTAKVSEPDIFRSRGLDRRRFGRPEDAHIYMLATK